MFVYILDHNTTEILSIQCDNNLDGEEIEDMLQNKYNLNLDEISWMVADGVLTVKQLN